ncbi:specifically androgen-regulated gene protein [Tachysurus fulvidraco]|uniref:specifically androgen-regulated gene protein n=1 Tax=Tachysurus fulvidraco TaxID=1234273 RepID=UPI000F50F9E9|nr:specifically androgen-regulated gene protein [Tachysurus fulvidraco]XP_027021320.1 specifically androgen-regulated gene protein [Tachysurus fulvidraco]XP_027021327.1 specifically androgen-regulated gene protein [Tachysurus fulvidraco]XP_027021346.1 specifically androgen-regulated gene protein [Tachysurus fulvidraco]
MPMRDSWPCDSASGSSLSMNSASSCDSVISINSGYSDDSMEHLSAEERACLMYLEETIESLVEEDDSGVSNDEPDHPSRKVTNKMNHLHQVNPEGLSVHDNPNTILGKDHRSRKLLVPTPLVLANGNSKLLKKKDFSSTEQKPAVLVNTPKTSPFNSHQSSALPTFAGGTAISPPNPGRHEPNAYSYSDLTDGPPPFIPEPPVRPDTSSGPIAKDHPPKSNLQKSGSDKKPKSVSSEIPVVLLPPPSDFMDEPVLLPPANTPCQSESMPVASPGFDRHIGTNKSLPSLSTSPRLSINDLDKLRKKASIKKTPEIAPVVQAKSVHNVPDQASSPKLGPDPSATTAVEYVEPKSPPSVAPKPKKLPSSIVLKTHKDAAPGHTLVSPGDRMMINQQKVHQEALKKLGLLKPNEIDVGFCPSPPNKASPQTYFNTSTSVASPAEHTGTTDSVLVHAEHHAVVEAQGKTAFSYLPVNPEKGENLLITRAPSPKPYEIKSASMERSGAGLKSFTLENPSHLTSQEESLRNSRSQPAYEGSLKDFSVNQTPAESTREPELRRSLPIPVPSQPKVEPQKPLRSHGISVVISPERGDDRKQALRRLGLGMIKD